MLEDLLTWSGAAAENERWVGVIRGELPLEKKTRRSRETSLYAASLSRERIKGSVELAFGLDQVSESSRKRLAENLESFGRQPAPYISDIAEMKCHQTHAFSHLASVLELSVRSLRHRPLKIPPPPSTSTTQPTSRTRAATASTSMSASCFHSRLKRGCRAGFQESRCPIFQGKVSAQTSVRLAYGISRVQDETWTWKIKITDMSPKQPNSITS
jgi:hypothetical protein